MRGPNGAEMDGGPHRHAEEEHLVLGGGFAILKANSREEMMIFIGDFRIVAGGGECNVRIPMDGPPPQ